MVIRRAKGWLIAAVVFGLINAAGAVMAAVQLEPLHAATHFALAVLSAYVARWLMGSSVPGPVPAFASVAPGEFDDRLTKLEQSLEGLATGVERVGEGQRFINHLFADDATRAHDESDWAAPR